MTFFVNKNCKENPGPSDLKVTIQTDFRSSKEFTLRAKCK